MFLINKYFYSFKLSYFINDSNIKNFYLLILCILYINYNKYDCKLLFSYFNSSINIYNYFLYFNTIRRQLMY